MAKLEWDMARIREALLAIEKLSENACSDRYGIQIIVAKLMYIFTRQPWTRCSIRILWKTERKCKKWTCLHETNQSNIPSNRNLKEQKCIRSWGEKVPSKLPCPFIHWSRALYVSSDGRNTKTPELKQSGQPASGAAENSSRSNNSSIFCRTLSNQNKQAP